MLLENWGKSTMNSFCAKSIVRVSYWLCGGSGISSVQVFYKSTGRSLVRLLRSEASENRKQ